MTIEICAESIEGALAAERGGADRVELCSGLSEGGVTPSAGCIHCVRRKLSIELYVLIRPRPGDFLYTSAEFELVLEDIRIAKAAGADGVVVGCLTPEGEIDVERMRECVELARPMAVTFHRAFDLCRDPLRALEQLIELGCDRVLTSGQEANALAGTGLIAELVRRSRGKIVVVAGGGVNAGNARELIGATGVTEIHSSARGLAETGMRFRNPRCSMGSASLAAELSWHTTDEQKVRAMVDAVRKQG